MKKIKNIKNLSLVLIFLMFFQLNAFAASGKAESWQKVSEILKALDIMTDFEHGDFGGLKPMTRADFSHIIYSFINPDSFDRGITVKTPFSDVPERHWAAPYIDALVKLGIMSGYDDGMFYPQSGVTIEDVLQATVTLLGYSEKAKVFEGRAGYMTVAVNLGLLNGTSARSGIAKRGDIAIILYNALNTDIADQNTFGYDIHYEITKGNTLMKSLLSAVSEKGMVIANSIGSVDSAAGVQSKGRVAVRTTKNEIKILIDNKGLLRASLGLKVDYIRTDNKDDDVDSIIYSIPTETDMLVIDARDIDRVSDGVLYYHNSAKKLLSIRLPLENAIYNGRPESRLTVSDIIPKSGCIKLYDQNGTGKYSLMVIENIETIVVQGVDEKREVIYDTTTGHVDLSDTNDYNIIFEGTETDLSKIRENDVLAVEKSKDDRYCKITISRSMVTGTAVEISVTDEDEYSVLIDNKAYNLSKSLSDYIISGLLTLNVGDSGSFYIDIFGDIAGFDISSAAGKSYGYILSVGRTDSSINGGLKLKILTSASGVRAYETNGTINFSDENGYERKIASEPLKTILEQKNGLIQFRLDSYGFISYIELPKNSDSSFTASNNRRSYYYYNKSFERKFFVDNQTVMFFVPDNATKDEEYAAYTGDKMPIEAVFYTAESYDLSERLTAGAIVVYQKPGNQDTNDDTPLGLFEKITSVVDEDGELAERIYYLAGDNTASYIIDENCTFRSFTNISELKRGDIISMILTNGRVTRIVLVYEGDARKFPAGVHAAGPDAYSYYTNGVVEKTFSDSCIIDSVDARGTAVGDILIAYQDAIILVHDKAGNLLYRGSKKDIAPGDTLMVRSWTLSNRLIVVYK